MRDSKNIVIQDSQKPETTVTSIAKGESPVPNFIDEDTRILFVKTDDKFFCQYVKDQNKQIKMEENIEILNKLLEQKRQTAGPSKNYNKIERMKFF